MCELETTQNVVFLTSTVHDFPDGGGGQDISGAQVVSQLTTDWHYDGHDKMGKSGDHTDLTAHKSQPIYNQSTTRILA